MLFSSPTLAVTNIHHHQICYYKIYPVSLPPGVIYGVSTVVLILTQSVASRLININTIWAPVFVSFLLITAGIATVSQVI